MRENLSPKWSFVVVVLAGVAFFAIFRFSPAKNFPILNPPLAASPILSIAHPEEARLDIPTHLKIPSINVDASVEQVGLTSDGAMDVPKEPQDVAWFDLGPRPGEVGSAVIAGHSGYKDNKPAVFDNLHKLQKEDKIYIEDKQGVITTFVVRDSRKYKSNTNPPEVFASDDGKAYLNLITCTGAWDKTAKSRFERLVIFAEKE